MTERSSERPQILRLPAVAWILAGIGLAAGYVTFRAGVDYSAGQIWNRPEYSYGLVIPFIAAFLVWQHRDWLEQSAFSGSWAGVAFLVGGIVLNVAGELSALFIIQRYAALMAFYGLVLALVGTRVFRRLWVPLVLLLFIVPLPDILYQELSTRLQLISSRVGVWVIRQFDISVFLEGNVIELRRMHLQVAEACNGLRYLFPLMTLGLVAAYFFKAALWKRILVFLSTIPITVAMNSLRIGLIGVTVEHWGPEMAEGVLHQFEGWVVFAACGIVLLVEIVVLARIGRDRRPWREVLGVEFPPPPQPGAEVVTRALPRSFHVAVVVLVAAAAAVQWMPERQDAVPARPKLIDFPMSIADRAASREPIEGVYLDVLRLDDYLMADYSPASADDAPINFYVAWYDKQRAGEMAHSPSTCLPAGGWAIEDFSQRDLTGVAINGHPVRVNRAVIRHGNNRQVAYYFFKQRQRILTGGYVLNWYLFWDAFTQNRTDGALIRLITPLRPGEDEATADARLTAFAADAMAELGPFVPD